jgi:NADH-quinone oxidoreductase subunit L
MNLVWVGLFLPLVSFLIILFSSEKISRGLTNRIACGAILGSFACFLFTLYNYYAIHDHTPYTLTLFNWINTEEIKANFSVHVDPLSIMMTLIITGVGYLIHLYSIGYMEHDEDYARYFASMNLFVFAMLLLVLASNLLLLFAGWEGVGLASYLLIGYYYTRPAAAEAAKKAFIVNRIGDLGLLVGILLTFYLFGTSEMLDVINESQKNYSIGASIIIILTFLYFVGAMGKSAQLPLHVWLPDAMEGPTPVSALIHAATMVTAGVYLVVRMNDVFMIAPPTLHFVGAIGGATSLFAALCACAQVDLKRVLAYSTVSQLGIMFLACGVGAFYAAMFHLMTHAFMKALLFLSAGNVVHMMSGTTDMNKMGGLAKKMPVTNIYFLIGVLAMSGVPPLSAFFSKDMILEQDYLAGFKTFFYIGLTASILTAFYLTRAYILTFCGNLNLNEKIYKSVKEVPRIMLAPVGVLAFLAIFGGIMGQVGNNPFLERFLGEVDIKLAVPDDDLFSFETALSVLGAILGIGAAVIMYTKYADKLGNNLKFLRKSFYVDEIYNFFIVKPINFIAAWITRFIEPNVFDGSIKALSLGTYKTAAVLQKTQSGQIRSYVAWMALGAVLLITYFII